MRSRCSWSIWLRVRRFRRRPSPISGIRETPADRLGVDVYRFAQSCCSADTCKNNGDPPTHSIDIKHAHIRTRLMCSKLPCSNLTHKPSLLAYIAFKGIRIHVFTHKTSIVPPAPTIAAPRSPARSPRRTRPAHRPSSRAAARHSRAPHRRASR